MNVNIPGFDIEKRECGDCHVCCVVPQIEHLDKPARVTCSHLTECGCGCYETRGEVCRGYKCLWLLGAMGVGNRPDKLGAYYNLVHFDEETPCIVVGEVYPGALDSSLVEWINRDIFQPATGLMYRSRTDGTTAFVGEQDKVSRAVAYQKEHWNKLTAPADPVVEEK